MRLSHACTLHPPLVNQPCLGPGRSESCCLEIWQAQQLHPVVQLCQHPLKVGAIVLHEQKRGFCCTDTLMYELSGTLVVCACLHVYIIPLVMLLSQTQPFHSRRPPDPKD